MDSPTLTWGGSSTDLPPAGIDKVQIQTRDFKIQGTYNLKVTPLSKPQGSDGIENPQPLFALPQGELVYGSHAKHYGEGKYEGIVLSINRYGMSITFNPSKHLGKFSGHLADVSDTVNSLTLIEEYFKTLGIQYSTSDSNITRFDVAKDRLMTDKVWTYQGAWNIIDPTRLKEAGAYSTSVLFANKSKEFSFYDKDFEMTENLSNKMRGELRLLKPDSVKSVMNISKVNHLSKLDDEFYRSAYKEYILKDLYHTPKEEQLSIKYATENKTLTVYLDELGRGGAIHYISMGGVSNNLERIGGVKEFRNILKESERFTNEGIRLIIRKTEMLVRLEGQCNSIMTTADRYNEIRMKFAS